MTLGDVPKAVVSGLSSQPMLLALLALNAIIGVGLFNFLGKILDGQNITLNTIVQACIK